MRLIRSNADELAPPEVSGLGLKELHDAIEDAEHLIIQRASRIAPGIPGLAQLESEIDCAIVSLNVLRERLLIFAARAGALTWNRP